MLTAEVVLPDVSYLLDAQTALLVAWSAAILATARATSWLSACAAVAGEGLPTALAVCEAAST